jgi:hypothetical protein
MVETLFSTTCTIPDDIVFLFLFLFIYYDAFVVEAVGPVEDNNNACGDRILPRSNNNIESTTPNRSNMRPIMIKILEYEKSYLHMGSELISISILFYYLSSRCEGLANEVLRNEVL